ncbi:MAG: RNase adapter RapZ [Thermodesulfobacteriota bacterium]|nr:RNase adapter RapZ [Thermodesulfobacteriota bacterium]
MGAEAVQNLRIVIVTGLSGSGKSTVIRVLEDMGFFCVDNLPIVLLPKLFELCSASLGEYSRIALVMDLRERDFLKTYPEVIGRLKEQGYQLEILFLEASNEALVRRYSQTRRTHPLAEGCGVLEGIHKERQMLAGLRAMATLVIDTSTYNVHQLQGAIREIFEQKPIGRKMNLTFLSFGYSRGIPPEADIVIDVRFLPNPFFEEELKTLPGTDTRISDYLIRIEETREFLERFYSLLEYLLPLYEREGKAYLTVAVGCTGGRHRSVAIAERLGNLFQEKFPVRRRHRDLEASP